MKGNLIHELNKGLFQFLQTPIFVQVIVVDVGHDRANRTQVEETPVAFICLGHQVGTRTTQSVTAPRFHLGSHDGCRL